MLRSIAFLTLAAHAAAEPDISCAVCGLRFRDTEELKAHANRGGLQPVRRVRTYACDACGREFGEERALLQHRNFCERGSASTSS